MKALILCAGYATRLYPLTENQPKPLLKVGGKEIINHILDKISGLNVEIIYVVTNNKFYRHFLSWKNELDDEIPIKIINDGTLSNEDRLGSIGDIHFILEQENITDDLLVIAGDNLFGFSLHDFVDFFNSNQTSIVAFRDLNDLEKVKGKFGVGILEGTRVKDFEEKPMEPKSALASTACYLFSKKDLGHVKYLVESGNADAPGNLIKHLAQNTEVHGFVFDEHWFDIGSFESLKEAEEKYEN
jgi:glucose-1-phosphate thymidylyltransferase